VEGCSEQIAGSGWMGVTSQRVRKNQCHTIPMNFYVLFETKNYLGTKMNFFFSVAPGE
jgi:hypothetical protein